MSKCKKIITLLLIFVVFLSAFSLNVNAVTSSQKSIVFDGTLYLKNNSDLKKAFGNDYEKAYNHFLKNGIKEGRVASLVFDVKYYLSKNSDLKKAFGNDYEKAYNHFLKNGIKEGRVASPLFDVKYYLSKNSDLKKAFGNDYEKAYNHFLKNGIKEGRVASSLFDVKSYVGRYNDLSRIFGTNYKDAYIHYLTNGIKEGRIATPITPTIEPSESPKAALPQPTPTVEPSESPKAALPQPTPTVKSSETPKATLQQSTPTVEPSIQQEVNSSKENKTEHVHEFSDWTITKPSKCNSYGEKQRECLTCGEIETSRLLLTDHEYVKTYYVDATCIEGAKQYSTCSVCHGTFFNYISTPLGHDYQDDVTIEAATCTKDGRSYRKCSRCDAIIDEKIDKATGHDYQPVSKEATCTSNGYEGQKCSKCGDLKISKTFKAIAHKFENFINDNNATCTSDETKTAYCEYGCGTKSSIKIPGTKLSHNLVEEERIEPTCTENGKSIQKCKDCDYTITNTIPKLGHNWENKKVEESTCTGSMITQECSRCKLVDIVKFVYTGEGHVWADPNGNKGFEGNYCLVCKKPAPNWTNEWADRVYATLFHEIWNEEHEDEYDFPLVDIYRLSKKGQEKFFEEIEKRGGNRYRVVWGIGLYANNQVCEGFGENHESYMIKTVITADWEFKISAPKAKSGYEFEGWYNKVTGKFISSDSEITATWRDKDVTLEARYREV